MPAATSGMVLFLGAPPPTLAPTFSLSPQGPVTNIPLRMDARALQYMPALVGVVVGGVNRHHIDRCYPHLHQRQVTRPPRGLFVHYLGESVNERCKCLVWLKKKDVSRGPRSKSNPPAACVCQDDKTSGS